MIRYSAAVLFASLLLLTTDRVAAQEPDLAGEKPLVSIRATGVQALVRAWPNTKLGKLMADEDVIDAAAAVVLHTHSQLRRQHEVRQSFTQLSVLDDMRPHEIAMLYGNEGDNDLRRLLRYPLEQVTRAEITIALADIRQFDTPSFLTYLSCAPRYEGRWTQDFEQQVQHYRNSGLFEEVKGTKIDGFPAYAFHAPKSVTGDEYMNHRRYAHWMMHMPGTFMNGNGTPTTPSADATKQDDAAVSLVLDLQSYVEMFQREGMGIPSSFAALGFDGLQSFKWSGRFRGELIEDRIDVKLNGTPSGLIAAVLTGTGKLPAQALPNGAIAQLRSAVNMKALAELLPLFAREVQLPGELVDAFLKACDGGIAIGCCAPAPGGVIPRIYLSLSIADETALAGLFKQFLTDNLSTKKVNYSGIECTVLKIPDMPNGIQPAFCRVNGTLHIAESALSLRAFLKVQDEDTVAMDVEDAPVPSSAGQLLPTFDWRFDEAELYKCFYEDWLPLYELTGMANCSPIRRKDMPEPDVVEMYCGKSRGVLRKDGDNYSIVVLGALGGPELAALAMTWGPMLASEMNDHPTELLTRYLATRKLDTVHVAVATFQEREKRLPKDLAELFTAQELAADALLLPADELAEPVMLPDGRTVKSSFRYFQKPVEFATNSGNDGPTILIEIRPRPYNRIIMTTSGAVPEVYGPGTDSETPINQFGKGGSGALSAPAGHNHK